MAVVVCLPGGRTDRRYWDLPVPGPGFSFAHHACDRDVAVLLLDHLGTGGSARPDPPTPAADVAAANAAATDALLLAAGLAGLPRTGIGHSLGAALMLRQQVDHHSFDQLAVLGFPTRELTFWRRDGVTRWTLSDERGPTAGSSADIAYTNIGPRLPDELFTALREISTPVPPTLSRWVTRPGVVTELAAAVDVPVLLGFGERDVTPDPQQEPSGYPMAPLVRLQVLPGSFHCHNLAPTRHRLWNRLVAWAVDPTATEHLHESEATP